MAELLIFFGITDSDPFCVARQPCHLDVHRSLRVGAVKESVPSSVFNVALDVPQHYPDDETVRGLKVMASLVRDPETFGKDLDSHEVDCSLEIVVNDENRKENG